jgi:hypothetical protein
MSGFSGKKDMIRKLKAPWAWEKAREYAIYREKARSGYIPSIKSTQVWRDKSTERVVLTLYGTDVVEWYEDGRILIRTEGHETPLTRARIHDFTGLSIGSIEGSTGVECRGDWFFNEIEEILLSAFPRDPNVHVYRPHAFFPFPVIGDKSELMLSSRKGEPDFVWYAAHSLPRAWTHTVWNDYSPFKGRLYGPTGWWPRERGRYDACECTFFRDDHAMFFRDMASFEPVYALHDQGWSWRNPAEADEGHLAPWHQAPPCAPEVAMAQMPRAIHKDGWTMKGPTVGEAVNAFSRTFEMGFRAYMKPEWFKDLRPSELRRRVRRIHVGVPGKAYIIDHGNTLKHVRNSFSWTLPGHAMWPGGPVKFWLELEPTPTEAEQGSALAIGWTSPYEMARARVDPQVVETSCFDAEHALDKVYQENNP